MPSSKSIGRSNVGALVNANKALQDVDIEYKRHKLQFCMQVAALNTHRVKTPEEMEERLQKLFELCTQTGDIPTYENLAVACGIPIRTFYDMSNATYERICRIPADYQKSKGHNCPNGKFYGDGWKNAFGCLDI